MADTASSSIGDITSEMQQLDIASGAARTLAKQTKNRRNKLAQRNWRTLKKHIAKLPQELQDEILDFTISFQPTQDNIVHITKKYKPPLGLQVSWYTRATFAKAYYSNTIFHFQTSKQRHVPPGPWDRHDRKYSPDVLCHAWLKTLVDTERDMIHTVRLEYNHVPYRSPLSAQRALDEVGHLIRQRFHSGLVDGRFDRGWASFDLRSDVLVFNIKGEEKWYRCKYELPTSSIWLSRTLRDRTRRQDSDDPAPFSISPADLARWRSDRQLELDRDARWRLYEHIVMEGHGGGPISGDLLKAVLKVRRSDFKWGSLR